MTLADSDQIKATELVEDETDLIDEPVEYDDNGDPVERDTNGEIVEHYHTVFDALKLLRTFCSQTLKKSQLLPTDLFKKVPVLSLLVEPITKIEELLGIPHQPAFIKAVVNKNGFTGFKYPDLALHNKKVSLIWFGQIFDIEPFLISQAKKKRQCEYDFVDNRLILKFSHPDCPDTKLFHINVYSQGVTKDTLDTMKIASVLSELKKILTTYTYSINEYLEDGRHEVKKVWEKNGFQVVTLADDRDFYCSDYNYKNLQECEKKEQPTILIVDGNRQVGNAIYKQVYVDGYPPSISLPNYVTAIAKEKGYDPAPTAYPEEIHIKLLGIEDTKARDKIPASFIMTLEYNGVISKVRPNTAIKAQAKNGLFKLKSFEGVTLIVTSTGEYVQKTSDKEGKPLEIVYTTVQSHWYIPDECKISNASLDGLKTALEGLM